MKNQIPVLGQEMTVRGITSKITKIWPLGTVDVLSIDGRNAYRVTGLYCKGWPK